MRSINSSRETETQYLYWLVLASPILFLILALLDALYFKWSSVHVVGFLFSVVAGLLFLNHIHIGFTFLMLYEVPELRAWVTGQFGCWRRFALRTAILIALLWLFFLGLLNLLPWVALDSFWSATVFLLLTDTLGSRHVLWQSQGLYLTLFSPEQNYPLLRRLMGMMGLAFVVTVFVDGLHRSTAHPPLFMLTGILALIGFLIWLSILRQSKGWQDRLFLLRYLLWPVNGLSPVGRIGFQAMHGIEYFWVYRNLSAAQRRPGLSVFTWARTVIMAPVVTAALGIVLLYHYFPNALAGDRNDAHKILLGLLSLNLAITFAHYELDHRLFKMKDPMTRQIVGPLLNRLR
jgi:hypothetical protein